MLLFIGSVEPQFVIDRYFNTSHVTVYQPQCYQHQSLYLISIHLMLLFIVDVLATQGGLHNFNTSHVTVYLLYHLVVLFAIIISIHLMLLFIYSLEDSVLPLLVISIHLMLLFIGIRIPRVQCHNHFNTSHVTVYLFPIGTKPWNYWYFNTSHVTVYPSTSVSKNSFQKFQYISCYCLSLIHPVI